MWFYSYSITKCIQLLVIMCSITWLLITITDKYLNNNDSNHRLRPIGTRSLIKQLQQNHKSYNIILFWTKYFDETIESYYYKYNNKSLSELECIEWNNCVVTSDRAYLPFSNALLFHWRDFRIEDMPAVRRSDQLWTLYNLEAPTYTHYIFADNLEFNITSSYRMDSDIYVPYGRIVGRNDSNYYNHYNHNHNHINGYINRIDFNNKSNLIVWFVSNCETPGNRESYVNQLSRLIPIDIYGKCGPHTCDPPRSDHCFQKVAKKYKFYLSFENSICRDYVTEKLFEALKYDILPVVFGGSHYESLLPNHSFIDANKLTPKQLAQHLLEIASNEQKYLSYFKWKEDYYVESGLDSKFEVFCQLCKRINSYKSYSSHSTEQIIEWWFRKGNCKTWNDKPYK